MLRMNICNVLSHNTGFNCGTVTLGVGQLISSVYWYDSQVWLLRRLFITLAMWNQMVGSINQIWLIKV